MLSIWFQNLKSSSTWFNPCFPLRRAILLLLLLSQFTYLSPPQEANTCVNCALIPTYLHIALVILLCIDKYPWDMHVISWKQPLKLHLPLCCFNTFTLIYCFMSQLLCKTYWCLSWSTIHEKSLLYDSFVYSCHLPLFWSLHSLHMLTIVWSRLWWHVTPEIIFFIVYLLGTSRN